MAIGGAGMKRSLPVCFVCGEEVIFAERVAVPGSSGLSQPIWVHHRCGIHLASDVLHALNPEEPRRPDAGVIERSSGLYRAGLTARELQALRCIARGHTNRQIAHELGVALKTARNLVSEILSKLDAVNRAEAVAIATREGLLD